MTALRDCECMEQLCLQRFAVFPGVHAFLGPAFSTPDSQVLHFLVLYFQSTSHYHRRSAE